MQVQWFPQSICDQVDRVIRNFLWQGNGEKGMHMVGWKTITRPKRIGGLGVRVARHHNTAMLGKLIWDLTSSPHKLWVSILRAKYFPLQSFLGVAKSVGSSTWNSLLKAREQLAPGFRFKVGNGDSNIWADSWITHIPLGKQVMYIDIHDADLRIRDLYTNGSWKLSDLYTNIPLELRIKIESWNPEFVDGAKDLWTWGETLTGIYTTKSAYQMLCHDNNIDVLEGGWTWLWKLKIPSNVQFFLWQFAHNVLPMRETLMRRHVLNNATCVRCNLHEETLVHCFFGCDFAKEVWNNCFMGNLVLPSIDFNPLEWMHDSIQCHGILCAIVLWKCWCARNHLLFEGTLWKPSDVVAQAYALMIDTMKVFGSYTIAQPRNSSGLEVSWKSPPRGWVALNVDGSATHNPALASYGGLIRDEKGRFLHGFYGSLGDSTIMHAELVALLKGLSLCWDMGYKKIVCYSDSLNTLKMIATADHNYHRHGNDISLIRRLLARDWEVQLHHVFREANFCADFLAKLGSSELVNYVVVEMPPHAMSHILAADALGISFVRP